MISEGSCHTEDWLQTNKQTKKKKNQLCHHRNKIYFQNIAIKINLVYIIIIFLQYYCFYSIRNFSYWERLKVLNRIYFSSHLPWHSNSPAHHNSICYPHIHLKRCPALHTRCAHTAPPHSAESRRKTAHLTQLRRKLRRKLLQNRCLILGHLPGKLRILSIAQIYTKRKCN